MVACIRAAMPNIRHIPSDDVIMLGAPVGSESSVEMVLNDKLAAFRLLAFRLTSLQAQDALSLLKNCSSTPKLLYMLRCAACYKSAVLSEYDGVIRDSLKIVLNVDLTDDIWRQATLSVSKGGLGVRLASDLALPAFLSSVNGARYYYYYYYQSWLCSCYQLVYTQCLQFVILLTSWRILNGNNVAP